jgi:hypothetical protein
MGRTPGFEAVYWAYHLMYFPGPVRLVVVAIFLTAASKDSGSAAGEYDLPFASRPPVVAVV